jgi:hypothetical protein
MTEAAPDARCIVTANDDDDTAGTTRSDMDMVTLVVGGSEDDVLPDKACEMVSNVSEERSLLDTEKDRTSDIDID